VVGCALGPARDAHSAIKHGPPPFYAHGRRRSPCAVAQASRPARRNSSPVAAVPVNQLIRSCATSRLQGQVVGCPFHWGDPRFRSAPGAQPRAGAPRKNAALDFLLHQPGERGDSPLTKQPCATLNSASRPRWHLTTRRALSCRQLNELALANTFKLAFSLEPATARGSAKAPTPTWPVARVKMGFSDEELAPLTASQAVRTWPVNFQGQCCSQPQRASVVARGPLKLSPRTCHPLQGYLAGQGSWRPVEPQPHGGSRSLQASSRIGNGNAARVGPRLPQPGRNADRGLRHEISEPPARAREGSG